MGGWNSIAGQEPYDESGGAIADLASAQLSRKPATGRDDGATTAEGPMQNRGVKRRWGGQWRR